MIVNLSSDFGDLLGAELQQHHDRSASEFHRKEQFPSIFILYCKPTFTFSDDNRSRDLKRHKAKGLKARCDLYAFLSRIVRSFDWEFFMSRSLVFLLTCIGLSPTAVLAQSTTFSHSHLISLEKTAQFQADYQALAQGYAAEAQHFMGLAEAQRVAYRQAVEHPIPGGKFPTQADTSRRMQEYYTSRSDQARAKQKLYQGKLK